MFSQCEWESLNDDTKAMLIICELLLDDILCVCDFGIITSSFGSKCKAHFKSNIHSLFPHNRKLNSLIICLPMDKYFYI